MNISDAEAVGSGASMMQIQSILNPVVKNFFTTQNSKCHGRDLEVLPNGFLKNQLRSVLMSLGNHSGFANRAKRFSRRKTFDIGGSKVRIILHPVTRCANLCGFKMSAFLIHDRLPLALTKKWHIDTVNVAEAFEIARGRVERAFKHYDFE